MSEIKLSELTPAQKQELMQQLENDQKKVEKQRKNERKNYEESRDGSLEGILKERLALQEQIIASNQRLHSVMNYHEDKLNIYGGIPKRSKGGFSVTHSNSAIRITRKRDTQRVWDERSQKAVELIKAFLESTVKKRDVKTFNLLLEFIAKNQNGDLEYSAVMKLISHQDDYDDPRWVEGLTLLKESFSNTFKAYTYEVKAKNKRGEWYNVTINEKIYAKNV